MQQPVTYSVFGGPPDDWRGLRVYDLETGNEVGEVLEVNVTEGWLVRYARNVEGSLMLDFDGDLVTEKLTGKFFAGRPARQNDNGILPGYRVYKFADHMRNIASITALTHEAAKAEFDRREAEKGK